MMNYILRTALVAATLLTNSCRFSEEPSVDVVTAATAVHAQKETVLPPDSGSYEVIGMVEGLKGYVVRYDETLYRGGELFSESAAQFLTNLNIHTIISITPNDHEREFCRRHGLDLVELPFEKTNGLSVRDLERFQETIRKGDGPFYVHCHGGAHRGGVLGVAFRMHVQGWSYEKALVEHGRLGGDLLADHSMLESVMRR